MQRQKNNLTQTGIAITVLGVAVYVAVTIGHMLLPLAGWAILIGIIIAIVGLVTPGRSSY
ncbi:MAG: hypothetical protein H7145_17605 [Akkermansiaceae bacterium]|nr:hypothetical protein [Armatimonadota bacterium]